MIFFCILQRSKSKNRNRTSSNSSNQATAHSAGSAPTGNRPASNVQLTSQAKTKDVGKNEVEKSENSKLSDSGKQRTVSSGGDTIVEAKITPTATKSGLLVLQNAKPASQIGLLKSSSFEQHDSGIESGDQPPSSSTSTLKSLKVQSSQQVPLGSEHNVQDNCGQSMFIGDSSHCQSTNQDKLKDIELSKFEIQFPQNTQIEQNKK